MPTYTSGDGKVGWKAVIGADPIEGVKADFGKPSRFEFKKQRSGTLRNGCPAQAAAEKQ
jgi:hypothetical protein